PQLFDHLTARFGLDHTQTVLDLGCGTGQLAIPLAAHVARVLAVDPEPAMLHEGARLAADHDAANIDWVRGDSYHLDQLDLPALDLAVIGAAFHWMDRDDTLGLLDQHVTPGGAVVIASGGAPATKTPPPWEDTITAIRGKYLGAARRAGSGTYTHPAEGHAEVLRRSPFAHVETREWTWTLHRDLDQVIGLQFSYSYSAPAQFTDEHQRQAFEDELRAALTDQFPAGDFTEQIRTEALIVTRP
ncbi:MAG: class I SAM-dependent methyltransferase, partial [Actinomycetes bacterium]